jgi:protein TonB
MLDQLVESRNHTSERKKFGGFMLSTGIVLVTVLTVGLVLSLFNQNIVLASDSLEISALVAPVPIETKPEPINEPKPENVKPDQNDQSKLPTRTDNVLRMDESPNIIPDKVSVTPSTVKARPNSAFLISKTNFDPVGSSSSPTGRGTGNGPIEGKGIQNVSKVVENTEKDKTEEPPPIIKKEVKPPPMISGGVVNGKARNLVMPSYPTAAKSVGAKGEVKVQVVIDEDGNVISASAVSGNPLLKTAAVNAAKASKFTPTTLTGQKVKVTGFIVYNFT